MAKLESRRFELVLCNARFGSRESGQNVLAYARLKDYRPATALITAEDQSVARLSVHGRRQVAIRTEELPILLGKVAELIGGPGESAFPRVSSGWVGHRRPPPH